MEWIIVYMIYTLLLLHYKFHYNNFKIYENLFKMYVKGLIFFLFIF